MRKLFSLLALGLGLMLSQATLAAPAAGSPPQVVGTISDAVTGTVLKVERDGRLQVQHEAIRALLLPATTSTFVLQDPSAAERLQPNTGIRFKAGKDKDGRLILLQALPLM